MVIARLALACLAVTAACKKKEEAKPAPTAETKPTETTPKAEAPKPTETAPTAESKPADKPAEPAAVKPAGGLTTQADYETKALALTDQLLSIFQQAGTNCDKLADGVNQFVDTNKAALDGANAFEKANPAAKKTLAAKMQERQQHVASKLGPAMQACQKHAGLKTALSRLSN